MSLADDYEAIDQIRTEERMADLAHERLLRIKQLEKRIAELEAEVRRLTTPPLYDRREDLGWS